MQFILGLRAGMLRLGVALVVVSSKNIALRCRRQYACLRSFQTPRMISSPDPVSGAAFLEPTPAVVWQSYSVSV